MRALAVPFLMKLVIAFTINAQIVIAADGRKESKETFIIVRNAYHTLMEGIEEKSGDAFVELMEHQLRQLSDKGLWLKLMTFPVSFAKFHPRERMTLLQALVAKDDIQDRHYKISTALHYGAFFWDKMEKETTYNLNMLVIFNEIRTSKDRHNVSKLISIVLKHPFDIHPSLPIEDGVIDAIIKNYFLKYKFKILESLLDHALSRAARDLLVYLKVKGYKFFDAHEESYFGWRPFESEILDRILKRMHKYRKSLTSGNICFLDELIKSFFDNRPFRSANIRSLKNLRSDIDILQKEHFYKIVLSYIHAGLLRNSFLREIIFDEVQEIMKSETAFENYIRYLHNPQRHFRELHSHRGIEIALGESLTNPYLDQLFENGNVEALKRLFPFLHFDPSVNYDNGRNMFHHIIHKLSTSEKKFDKDQACTLFFRYLFYGRQLDDKMITKLLQSRDSHEETPLFNAAKHRWKTCYKNIRHYLCMEIAFCETDHETSGTSAEDVINGATEY